MDEETKQTIELQAGQALSIVQSVLPFLKAAIPALAAAGGPIGLGVSAAMALLPLIRQIPTGKLISDEEQQKQIDDIERIGREGFVGNEWKQSAYTEKSQAERDAMSRAQAPLTDQPVTQFKQPESLDYPPPVKGPGMP